jgi:nucleoside-diphosphate-sugar epimerase
MVGMFLTSRLASADWQVTAFSRRAGHHAPCDRVVWQRLPHPGCSHFELNTPEQITAHWICVAPIWAVPEHFDFMRAHGIQRLVVLSSTSRFTKHDSHDSYEQATASRLAQSEAQVQTWALQYGVQWTILRPTLIYALGQDKNVSAIAHFIRRFGFFPLIGKATGLRQPVHAADVADACVAAMQTPRTANHAYNISGSEALTYRAMVERIFHILGRRSRFVKLPVWSFRLAISLARLWPRYRNYSVAMAERMNRDLAFDYHDAAEDFGFQPRGFLLDPAVGAKAYYYKK